MVKTSRLLLHNDLTVNSDKLRKAVVKLLLDVISVLVILGTVYLLFPVGISSNEDMYPFMREGDIAISYIFDRDYKTGDVVFFKDESGTHIGRIVAKGGDTIDINGDEKVYVNSYPLSEEVFYPTLPGDKEEIKGIIADNSYYLLCDHRTDCRDSRYYGTVPKERLLGRVFMVIRRRNI
ncbi:MAG: signal peptidase I [Clostridia bacterium]|nr:signal peptidase I [Clostridia bacterium]